MLYKLIRKFKKVRHNLAISPESIEERFANIYKYGIWKSKGQSKSGLGSSLESTECLRNYLQSILKKTKAQNIIDLGCGDFYWMNEVELPCPYIGLDIVASIIEENKKMYASKNRNFLHHNAISDPLPLESDFVLCREVLFHLSFQDGLQLIKNVLNSRARYFMITDSDLIKKNKDIRTGQFRNINLNLPPYNFPPCIEKIQDSITVSKNRNISLWDVATLKKEFMI